MKPGETVYDSSAGNGMLLIDSNKGIANELNDGRVESLQGQEIQTTKGDATSHRLESPVPVVKINPPFGKIPDGKGRYKKWKVNGLETNQIDHAITANSLQDMADDGRAVVIVGSKGFEKGEPKDELGRGGAYRNQAAFYSHLYDNYNVIEHVTAHGDLYSKQGASFPVDVIVIDGKGKSSRPKPYQIDKEGALPRVLRTWEDVKNAVVETRGKLGAGRPSDSENKADDVGGIPVEPEAAVGEPSGGDGGRRDGGDGDGGRTVRGEAGGDTGRSGSREQDDAGRSEPEPVSDESEADGAGRVPRERRDGGENDSELKAEKKPEPKKKKSGDAESEFQVSYEPSSKVDGVGTLSPKSQADASQRALARVAEKFGDLDSFVADELGYDVADLGKYFSAEQVDAIAMAIAKHKEGKAFVVGDATGVGKGRVGAAIMVYAQRQGMMPVFVTQDASLYADMYRDLRNINRDSDDNPWVTVPTNTLAGKDAIRLNETRDLYQTHKQAESKLSQVADMLAAGKEPVIEYTVRRQGQPVKKVKEKVDSVFTTYSQLQTVKGNTTNRQHQLSRIAPNAFFILDESHNAGGSGQKDAEVEGRAAFARGLIRDSMGGVFLSATYAKNPKVMDLYAKTGMADSVTSEESLPEIIERGGVPLQQVLSEMLVEAGAMLRRERSYDGVEFGAKTEKVDRQIVDDTAEMFSAINDLDRIKQRIVKSRKFKKWLVSNGLVDKKDQSTGKAGLSSVTFSATAHNLVSQMLLSMKADAAADAAIAAHARGEVPVIALDNTLESALNHYLEDNPANVGDDIDFGFNSLASRYLERSRDVLLEDRENRTSRQLRLPDEVLGPEGVAAYEKARELVDNFGHGVSASPIDRIRQRLEDAGLSVSEITGRKLAINYDGDSMTLGQRPVEEQGQSGKRATIRRVEDGDVDVVIINQSGSTGISLHASKLFKNQKRRHMIIAQAAKNIDTFMQMLGRIHRTGQVEQHEGQPKGSNLPRYTLLMSDAPSEIRPAAVLMKKLGSLNANVTADSAGSVSFDVPDILNKVGDSVVEDYLSDNPELETALGLESSPVAGLAQKASGRIALRPLEEQEAFWEAVTATLQEELAELEKMGRNPLRASTLDLQAQTLESTEIFEGDPAADNPFAQPAYAERVRVRKLGEPMKPEEVRAAVEEQFGGEVTNATKRKWYEGQEATILHDAQAATAKRAERMRDRDAIDRMREKQEKESEEILDLVGSFAPGQSVNVVSGEEGDDPVPGVVIGVVAKKGRAHTKSGWTVKIATASPERTANVKLTRLYRDESKLPGNKMAAVTTGMRMERVDVLDVFDIPADAYEERIIGTGNILAAYGQLESGNVVFYTDKQGERKRGLLMPRKFNLDRWERERPHAFTKPEHVLEFTRQGHTATSPDIALQVMFVDGGLYVRAPKSRQKGGKWTTNRQIIDASGSDFVSKGQVMELRVAPGNEVATIQAIMEVSPLQTKANKSAAKDISDKMSEGIDSVMEKSDYETVIEKAEGFFGGGQVSRRRQRDGGQDSRDWVKSESQEVEERREQSHGVGKKKLSDLWVPVWDSFKQWTRPRKYIARRGKEGEFLAAADDLLRRMQSLPSRNSDKATRIVASILRPISDGQTKYDPMLGYEIFERKVVADNMVRARRLGQPLRNGYTSDEVLNRDHAKFTQNAESSPEVTEALENRQAVMQDLVGQLVEKKLLPQSVLQDVEGYFHQQVLEYQQSERWQQQGKKLKAKRSWQKKRVVMSDPDATLDYDYNQNYVQAEISWMADAFTMLEIESVLGDLGQSYDIKKRLAEEAKEQNYLLLVGGEGNAQRIEELKKLMKTTRNKDDRADIKEELLDLDPTYEYRIQIARGMSELKKIYPDRFGDDSESSIREVASIAGDDSAEGNGAARGVMAAINGRRNMMREELGRHFKEWEDMIPDGYAAWTPSPSNVFFPAMTVSERIATALQQEVIDSYDLTKEDLKEVMVMGQARDMMVLPEAIVAQLNEMERKADKDALLKVARKAMSSWKEFMLHSPMKIAGYTIRNITGDADAVLSSGPGIARLAGKSAKMLKDYYYGHSLKVPEAVQAAVNHAVLDSALVTEELASVMDNREFRQYFEDENKTFAEKLGDTFQGYRAAADKFSRWREGILRMSAFMHYRERLKDPEFDDFGASNKRNVLAVRRALGVDAAAAKMAREALGDYGDITRAGQGLRSSLIPFWSFQEINIKRTMRMWMNAAETGRTGRAAASTAAKAALRASRVAWMYGALVAWNNVIGPLFWGEDLEEELPEWMRQNPHVILGRSASGDVLALNNVGVFGDFLEWFGGNDISVGMATGTVDAEDIPKTAMEGGVNKVVGGLGPYKSIVEILTGQSFFPDAFNPRPIDRGEASAAMMGVNEEVKIGKRFFLGGDDSVDFEKVILRTMFGVTPAGGGESAVTDMYGIIERWQEDNGKEAFNPSKLSKFRKNPEVRVQRRLRGVCPCTPDVPREFRQGVREGGGVILQLREQPGSDKPPHQPPNRLNLRRA